MRARARRGIGLGLCAERRAALLLAALACVGCPSLSSLRDGAGDAGAGRGDAGAGPGDAPTGPAESGPIADAAAPDGASAADAAPPDGAGAVDSAAPADSGAPDGAEPQDSASPHDAAADEAAPPQDAAEDTTPMGDQPDTSTVRAADAGGGNTSDTGAPDATTNKGIQWVQENQFSATMGTQSNVSVTMKSLQAAGDLNVVAIGWFDDTGGPAVSTLTDAEGNDYKLAVGPTAYVSGSIPAVQVIYYAAGIAGDVAVPNLITVTFTGLADEVDVRVVEYAGLDPKSPLDRTASGDGLSGNAATPPTATTTYPSELLFAAAVCGSEQAYFTTSGPMYVARDVTANGNLVEDDVVSATGAYAATAPLHGTGSWVIQLATFH